MLGTCPYFIKSGQSFQVFIYGIWVFVGFGFLYDQSVILRTCLFFLSHLYTHCDPDDVLVQDVRSRLCTFHVLVDYNLFMGILDKQPIMVLGSHCPDEAIHFQVLSV